MLSPVPNAILSILLKTYHPLDAPALSAAVLPLEFTVLVG